MSKYIYYHNYLNTIGLKKFSEQGLNLFFFLLGELNNRGEDEITIPYYYIMENLKLKEKRSKIVSDLLKSTLNKLLKITFVREAITETNKMDYLEYTIFNKFHIKEKEKILIIRATPEAIPLLNNLLSNFTKIDFNIYLSLTTKYSKELYRHLRQFHKTKFWKVTIEQFNELFFVPNSYKFSHISERIIYPSIKELKEYYPNLEVSYIYEKPNGKGRPKVKSLEFTFKESNYIIFNGQKINPDTGEIYEEKPKPKLVIDKKANELTEEELIELLMAKKAQKENSQSWITDETKSILNRNFLKE